MPALKLHNDNINISCLRFGNTDGKPFVILPGISVKSVMGSAELIEKQYQSLAGEYDVYLIDRRSNIPSEYSIHDMADDTITALDMLGISDAVLYGVSQGGMMSLDIAVKRPDIVRKLVLCSTSAYANETSRAILDTWVKLAEEKAAEELVLSFAEKVYSREYSEKYRSAFIEFSRSITEEELDNFIIMVKGTYGFDVRDNIGCIKAPVLVMGAGQDMIFTDAPSKEIAQLTGGELYIYSKEAHGVYDEVPDVIARIKAFSDK